MTIRRIHSIHEINPRFRHGFLLVCGWMIAPRGKGAR
jgi:hypothetical protein